ncbi:MAG: 2-oxoglutarate and iron-dependent oxygenase domain-containing protein [Pseudomonadota bacterium]
MIPVLDFHDWERDPNGFADALGAACRGPGFLLLKGHGVPEALITRVFEQAAALFALPAKAKDALSIYRSPHNRGYAALGSESLDDTSEQVDQKEAFNIGLDLAEDDPRVRAGEPFRGVNFWPDLPGFKEDLLDYFNAVWSLGVALHRPIARDLRLPEGYFGPHFTAPMATLRLLHYPAGSPQEAIGAGAHTDYGSVTLLATDGVAGLQVQPRGSEEWVDVPHVEGAFVVNIGDCLMRWTNDIYISNPHRVIPPQRERFSVAFFLDPNPDSVIQALPGTGAAKYPPVTGAEYLMGRLTATYAEDA